MTCDARLTNLIPRRVQEAIAPGVLGQFIESIEDGHETVGLVFQTNFPANQFLCDELADNLPAELSAFAMATPSTKLAGGKYTEVLVFKSGWQDIDRLVTVVGQEVHRRG